ncbi:hypothetical protein O181_039893 [Austropuccinia psidii MF-1]|uniref:Uncharacterized protein n=1 Tax=Austropuccinia psidii MF-1 TaxID=1389203 RepID=A0A9Q3DE99_9BASI|nr:hypothetical protein [Austropuccinia psidii MF-1]
MEHGQQEVQPNISLGRTWSKFPEDLSQRDRLQGPYGNHQRLESYQAIQTPISSGFIPFRNQQVSDQESTFFTIPGGFQEETRIQGGKQDLFQSKEERVRPNHPEVVGFGKKSAQEPELVVKHSRISSPINRNITPTQIEHNVVTPDSNLNSDALWLQMSQYAEKTQKQCNHNCTLDNIENTLQEIRKRTNIGKYSPYKSSGFREKQPFRVEFKDKPRERVAEVTKKENLFHNCGSKDHYTNNCQKAKKKVYAIEKVPEVESLAEDSESDSKGDAIRDQSDEEKDSREEFLVEYQEETPLEIQDIQLEAGMPQDTANESLCKHIQDAQTFLVTPAKGIAYIHGTATKITVCIENSQHPLIIESGENFSIVVKHYLDNHFPNWKKQLLPTKAKNFKMASGKITSIGTIIKERIIHHRKGNIRLNPEFLVHITIGTKKEKKFSLDIYQISSQDPLEELLNEFREGQFSTTLTGKQKLSFLKTLRKNRPAFAIGEEPLGKIKGHDIELYLDVERPYPPMLRRPPYPERLESGKKIEKHINELLDMDFLRKIGHNEIVEITIPVLITWND